MRPKAASVLGMTSPSKSCAKPAVPLTASEITQKQTPSRTSRARRRRTVASQNQISVM